MPNSFLNVFYFVIIAIGFIFLVILRLIFAKKPRPAGEVGEEETLRITKNFLKNNNYKKEDYLLVNNLTFRRENY